MHIHKCSSFFALNGIFLSLFYASLRSFFPGLVYSMPLTSSGTIRFQSESIKLFLENAVSESTVHHLHSACACNSDVIMVFLPFFPLNYLQREQMNLLSCTVFFNKRYAELLCNVFEKNFTNSLLRLAFLIQQSH